MTAIERPGTSPGTGWDVLAADGSVVQIRPIRPDDEPALAAPEPDWYARHLRSDQPLAGS